MVEPTLNRLLVRAAGRIYSSLAIAEARCHSDSSSSRLARIESRP